MNLASIQDEWKKDSIINYKDVGTESIESHKLHSKYFNYLTDEALILRAHQKNYNKLYKLKWEYYLGILDEETMKNNEWKPFLLKISRNDLDIYLNSDDDLSNLTDKITIQQEKIKLLESIIKQISSRNYNIKNFIDWKKFENGIY